MKDFSNTTANPMLSLSSDPVPPLPTASLSVIYCWLSRYKATLCFYTAQRSLHRFLHKHK